MLSSRRAILKAIQTEQICALLRATQSSQWATSSRGYASTTSIETGLWSRHPPKTSFRRDWFSCNISTDMKRTGLAQSILHRSGRSMPSSPPVTPERAVDPGRGQHLSTSPDRRKDQVALPSRVSPGNSFDAASTLSTSSDTFSTTSLRRLFTTYLALSKPRLSFLMVLATATAYSLYPVPAVLLPSTTISPSLSSITLLFLTTGTAFCSASANALNMLLEPQHDAKMSRTKNRPIVRGLISRRGALIFAGITGIVGVGGLWFGVNPTVAFLGALTIFIYAGIYTPMKRISVVNTWIGAVVGSIPPLMGWSAAAGQSAVGDGSWPELLLGHDNMGGWLLAALLFAWQFPHFNALSWSIREEYKNAGYRMLSWTNSRMNGRVAFRYALLLIPICFGLTWSGVTDQGFLITSTVANGWMIREAWKFWIKQGSHGSARGLFWASVWHLPIVMVLAMVHKQGLWEGIWRRATEELTGGSTEEEDMVESEPPLH